MNHWFLCARDVMWFFIGSAPLFMFSMGIQGQLEQGAESPFALLVLMSVILQWVGIFLVYFQVIR